MAQVYCPVWGVKIKAEVGMRVAFPSPRGPVLFLGTLCMIDEFDAKRPLGVGVPGEGRSQLWWPYMPEDGVPALIPEGVDVAYIGGELRPIKDGAVSTWAALRPPLKFGDRVNLTQVPKQHPGMSPNGWIFGGAVPDMPDQVRVIHEYHGMQHVPRRNVTLAD